jgi:hypothetical protein
MYKPDWSLTKIRNGMVASVAMVLRLSALMMATRIRKKSGIHGTIKHPFQNKKSKKELCAPFIAKKILLSKRNSCSIVQINY